MRDQPKPSSTSASPMDRCDFGFCQGFMELAQAPIKTGGAIFRFSRTQPPDSWLTASNTRCDLGIRQFELVADRCNYFMSGIHAANIRE